MENIVIYDALSFTTKITDINYVKKLLGLENVGWTDTKGAHGYQNRLYYDCISIHFNGAKDMGIWVEMTGQGCRAFESYGHRDYELLFKTILERPDNYNITRLDVAYDDHTGIIDMDEISADTRQQQYVSRFNEWQLIEGSKGTSINHGSLKSEVYIRIYDKAAERQLTDGSHWIRCELQLRRDRALNFIKQKGDIGEKFSGVLLNYLRYVESDGDDSNKRRWGLKGYWANLIEDATAISLYKKPGTAYNLGNLQTFVMKQAGNAIDTYIKIFGETDFFERLHERGTGQNPKYDELIKRYRTDDRRNSDTDINSNNADANQHKQAQ